MEFNAHTKKIAKSQTLTNVVNQKNSKLSLGAYEICHENKNTMAYSDFLDTNKNSDEIFKNSTEEIENKFWATLAEGKEDQALYSIDNELSLFGNASKIWNLNKLTNSDSNIHNNPKKKGI